MKALVKYAKGTGNIEVRDVPKPIINNADDVLIKVKACGVCGTDLHILHDEFKNFPPVTLGHEFTGVIVECGASVVKWKPGDRVVVEPHTKYCGVCETCRQGKIHICEEKRSPGWGINGGFTDYVVVPELFLHKVPDNVPNEIAALAEPIAIVVHEVLERGRVEPQDFVAVVGAGPIGLLSAFVAKEGGASEVAILGINNDEELRFNVARKIGVDHIINIEKEDAKERIMDLTNGKGADLVVECSGAEGGINLAVSIIKKCGRLAAVGIPSKETISFPWGKCIFKVIDIKFNLSSSYSSWDRALSMMSKTRVDLSSLISHRESIENWERVFNELANGKGVKALFIPDSER